MMDGRLIPWKAALGGSNCRVKRPPHACSSPSPDTIFRRAWLQCIDRQTYALSNITSHAGQCRDKGGFGSREGSAAPESPASSSVVTGWSGGALSTSSSPAPPVVSGMLKNEVRHQMVASRGSAGRGMKNLEGEKHVKIDENIWLEKNDKKRKGDVEDEQVREDREDKDNRDEEGKAKGEEAAGPRTSSPTTTGDTYPEHLEQLSGFGHDMDGTIAVAAIGAGPSAGSTAPAATNALRQHRPQSASGFVPGSIPTTAAPARVSPDGAPEDLPDHPASPAPTEPTAAFSIADPAASEPTPLPSATYLPDDPPVVLTTFLAVALWGMNIIAGVYICVFMFRCGMLARSFERWSAMFTQPSGRLCGFVTWLRRRRSIAVTAWLHRAFTAIVAGLHHTCTTTIGRLNAAVWFARACFVAYCTTVPPTEALFYAALWLTNHAVGFCAWKYRRQVLTWIREMRLATSNIVQRRRRLGVAVTEQS